MTIYSLPNKRTCSPLSPARFHVFSILSARANSVQYAVRQCSSTDAVRMLSARLACCNDWQVWRVFQVESQVENKPQTTDVSLWKQGKDTFTTRITLYVISFCPTSNCKEVNKPWNIIFYENVGTNELTKYMYSWMLLYFFLYVGYPI